MRPWIQDGGLTVARGRRRIPGKVESIPHETSIPDWLVDRVLASVAEVGIQPEKIEAGAQVDALGYHFVRVKWPFDIDIYALEHVLGRISIEVRRELEEWRREHGSDDEPT
jgi:hypothetical protein